MELGEKLLQARTEAGLSQRQLCGEEITRNMLSQIEHGTAKPSMSTLAYLARRLGKPVSFFLEEEGTVSVNQGCMETAWTYYEKGEPKQAAEALEGYCFPDPVYDREFFLLKNLTLLELAGRAIGENREIYARELLEQAEELEQYTPWLPELAVRRVRLLGRLPGLLPSWMLPDLDEDLLLRGRMALQAGKPERAAQILDAAADRENPLWSLLRGRAALQQQEYGTAARYLQEAEEAYPEALPLLERCFRELGDYRMAYYYACKGRDGGKQAAAE